MFTLVYIHKFAFIIRLLSQHLEQATINLKQPLDFQISVT